MGTNMTKKRLHLKFAEFVSVAEWADDKGVCADNGAKGALEWWALKYARIAPIGAASFEDMNLNKDLDAFFFTFKGGKSEFRFRSTYLRALHNMFEGLGGVSADEALRILANVLHQTSQLEGTGVLPMQQYMEQKPELGNKYEWRIGEMCQVFSDMDDCYWTYAAWFLERGQTEINEAACLPVWLLNYLYALTASYSGGLKG
jgi:hypothetical protein